MIKNSAHISRVLSITKTDIIILWCFCHFTSTVRPANKLQRTKQHYYYYYFVIKTRHSQSLSTFIYVQMVQGQSLRVWTFRVSGDGRLFFNTCLFCIKYSLK